MPRPLGGWGAGKRGRGHCSGLGAQSQIPLARFLDGIITGDGLQECDRICVGARLPRNAIEVARGWARPSPDRVLAIPPDRGFFIEASPLRRGPARNTPQRLKAAFGSRQRELIRQWWRGWPRPRGWGLREEVGAVARVGWREQRKATSPCRSVDIYEGYRDRVSLGDTSPSTCVKSVRGGFALMVAAPRPTHEKVRGTER